MPFVRSCSRQGLPEQPVAGPANLDRSHTDGPSMPPRTTKNVRPSNCLTVPLPFLSPKLPTPNLAIHVTPAVHHVSPKFDFLGTTLTPRGSPQLGQGAGQHAQGRMADQQTKSATASLARKLLHAETRLGAPRIATAQKQPNRRIRDPYVRWCGRGPQRWGSLSRSAFLRSIAGTANRCRSLKGGWRHAAGRRVNAVLK